MEKRIKLNYVPKLSNNLCQIKITYDRDLKGFKVELVSFRVGEEQLLSELIGEIAQIMGTNEFKNHVLQTVWKDMLGTRAERFKGKG